MREQEPDIEKFESLDPVQLEVRMTVGNLAEGLSLIEKGLQQRSSNCGALPLGGRDNFSKGREHTEKSTTKDYLKNY
ncbi:hypothetical protein TNCV_2171291 [Trichonephila clavipes]|nr:hypothetical protein TNCV_2171291 [Trichonephila clavipes]